MVAEAIWIIAALAAQTPASDVMLRPPEPPPLPATPPPPAWERIAIPRNNPGLWVTTDDYPGAALRMEWMGTVAFRLAIGPDGRVRNCFVTLSTGYEVLDSATCRNLTRRARFSPALNQDGQPVEGKYASRVRWALPDTVSAGQPNIAIPPNTIDGRTGWIPTIDPKVLPARTAPYWTSYVLAVSKDGIPTKCTADYRHEVDEKIAKREKQWDNYACNKALAERRFTPAQNASGNAVPSVYYGHISWPAEYRPEVVPEKP